MNKTIKRQNIIRKRHQKFSGPRNWRQIVHQTSAKEETIQVKM